MEFVRLEEISMDYQTKQRETRAIENISFKVSKGEFVSIVGPSGCGKSTLLSIICGLYQPTSGIASIEGKNCMEKPVTVGYMLQKDHLFEWRSIWQNALLGLEISNTLTKEKEDFVEDMLKKYGLWEFRKSRPSELSGGMRQRAALIRTLAIEPEILLLDEPFSALDYQTRLFVADEVGDILRNECKTAILVTHDIAEAISLSDRVIVLSKRPSIVKSIHQIDFPIEHRRAMQTREDTHFREYFNDIWKELDICG